ADQLAAGHGRLYPDARRGQRKGEGVGEAGDLADLDLVAPDHVAVAVLALPVARAQARLGGRRPGVHPDEARVDVEGRARRLYRGGLLLDVALGELALLAGLQQRDWGQLPLAGYGWRAGAGRGGRLVLDRAVDSRRAGHLLFAQL